MNPTYGSSTPAQTGQCPWNTEMWQPREGPSTSTLAKTKQTLISVVVELIKSNITYSKVIERAKSLNLQSYLTLFIYLFIIYIFIMFENQY